MPTYEYECSNCKHKFELFQSMTDSAIKKCPKCNKLQVKRLIGFGSGIIFKGSGFYATDYRKSSKNSEANGKPTSACSGCSPSDCPHAKNK